MANEFAYDVFLSYNQADREKVLRLAQRLKDAGVRVWLDNWIVKPGDIITLKMDQGLLQSRVLLLCMSPAALSSSWVALEQNTVIYRDPTNEDRRFIPLLLTDCELPDTLRRYKYIDYRDESEEIFQEVLASCKTEVEENTIQPKLAEQEPVLADEQEPEPLAILERELKGHKDWVHNICVSPDGMWMASASGDKTIKLWDLETGDYETTLKGHTENVNTIAITSDGQTILSGSFDNTIRVWEVNTLECNATIAASRRVVMAITLMPDSQQAISCGAAQDPDFKIWDIKNYQQIGSVKNTVGLQYSIATYEKGKRLISGGEQGDIYLWELSSGKMLTALGGHTKAIRSIQVTPNGRFAVSGSDDKTIKIWDLAKETCIGTLEGHQHSIYSVAISSDGKLIASTGFLDKTVRIWQLESGNCLHVIKTLENTSAIAVAFSPDSSKLIVGTAEGSIFIYHLIGFKFTTLTETAHRYVNAKVVLLGEGTAGKTSLAHRLIEDKYVIKDRTHGMNVWRLDLPTQKDDTIENEALLWDLAGQEDYRLIHRLFLDQTSLALLLVNPQKEDPFEEVGEWLKVLQTVSKDTIPCLLIFSQVDVGGMKLSNAKIERFKEQFGFIGWLSTSAKTGENCSDAVNMGKPSRLKQLIAESIPWEKLPWTSTPHLLTDLKNAVMLMRDEADIRLLRFSELAQRLEQSLPGKMFTATDIRTAVALLANHGLVRPLLFGDLVLLRPDLINGYAAAVIRAARTHTDEIGCVSEASIYQPGFDFTGVDRLQQSDEELLLHALVQTFLDHSLCIAEETPTGRQLVFPSQYRREKDIPNHPAIFVSYTFAGEWQTIWTTLVVRLWYSHEFEQKELWRNAAEFTTSKGQTLGLLVQKESDGLATISLYLDTAVPDELKTIFIEYVQRHLAKYACDVVRDHRYICLQCKQPVTDLAIVRQRKHAGKNFIICQQCDEKIFFDDFIKQRLENDPIAQKILDMEAVATQELDTQAVEQILIGHMMAIAGEANQIFRPVTMSDYGIDGEIEFKDNNGKASGKKIYVQLKHGNAYLRLHKNDDSKILDSSSEQHLQYWLSQPVDVYVVIRQKDKNTGEFVILWMNMTQYLKNQKEKEEKEIEFSGEILDMKALYRVRNDFFPAFNN